MNSLVVYTNNPATADFLEAKRPEITVKWLASTSIDVLAATRTALNKGAVLLSDPMAGTRGTLPLFASVPAAARISSPGNRGMINPFMSLLIVSQPGGMLDFMSVKRLDETIGQYKKNAKSRFIRHNDDAIRNFQISDVENLAAALSAHEQKNIF